MTCLWDRKTLCKYVQCNPSCVFHLPGLLYIFIIHISDIVGQWGGRKSLGISLLPKESCFTAFSPLLPKEFVTRPPRYSHQRVIFSAKHACTPSEGIVFHRIFSTPSEGVCDPPPRYSHQRTIFSAKHACTSSEGIVFHRIFSTPSEGVPVPRKCVTC